MPITPETELITRATQSGERQPIANLISILTACIENPDIIFKDLEVSLEDPANPNLIRFKARYLLNNRTVQIEGKTEFLEPARTGLAGSTD